MVIRSFKHQAGRVAEGKGRQKIVTSKELAVTQYYKFVTPWKFKGWRFCSRFAFLQCNEKIKIKSTKLLVDICKDNFTELGC